MKTKFTLVAVAFAMLLGSCAKAPEKTYLFNGKDLNNWVFALENNSVLTTDVYKINKDRNILIEGKPFGYMRTEQKYGDYKLHVEWRWVGEGTNSGIFVHVQDGDQLWPNAIECQLCNGKAGDYVMLGGSKIEEIECIGQFPVKDRVGNYEKPAGEWNEAEIIMEGRKITVYINGQFQNECTCDSTDGYIALQSEGGPLEFRNVYIK